MKQALAAAVYKIIPFFCAVFFRSAVKNGIIFLSFLAFCGEAAFAGIPDSLSAGPSAAVLFSADGRPLRRYAGKDGLFREPVQIEQISPWVILAALAAEDKRFFKHGGVDIKAVARAAAQNMKAGHTVSGASTITQQLYRAYNPGPHTFRRKAAEAFSAVKIEHKYSKEEILQAYLNMIPYGNNIAGIQAAAITYFGVSAAELSLSQAAALSGIPRAPALYNPVLRPEAFEKRRKQVLLKMREAGYIDDENYRIAILEKPEAKSAAQPFFAPHFSNWVLSRLNSLPDRNNGIVITTLVPEIQEAAVAALKNNIQRLEKKHHVTNGAAIVLDNHTGGVLAWAGSKDFFDSKNSGQIDGVRALRQPGSALKPFLYGLAFSKGHSPADVISDEPLYGIDGYTPQNYDKHNHGMVRMREALACSYNIPAVRLAEETGAESFLETLHAFGFESLHRDGGYYGAGLALGNGEVTLLELAAAYAALARGGIWQPVIFEKGKAAADSRRVLDERSAFLVNSVLSDNQARAAAFGTDSPMNTPFVLAAKTGTSKDYRDNWCVGYTPEWTVAVWAGNFDGSPMRRISGITGAAPIMREIAMRLHSIYGSSDFIPPEGIEEREICTLIGMAGGGEEEDSCQARITEYFNSDFPFMPHMPMKRRMEAGTNEQMPDFPKDNDIFKIDPSYPAESQALRFRAPRGTDLPVWYLDGKKISGDLWVLAEGKHSLYFVYKGVKSLSVKFMVVR